MASIIDIKYICYNNREFKFIIIKYSYIEIDYFYWALIIVSKKILYKKNENSQL